MRVKNFMNCVLAVASVLALAACSDERVTADVPAVPKLDIPFMPTPVDDAFYAQPDPLPDVPPGTILKSREATFAPGGVPLPNPAWQLQYMSRDLHGRPQTAVATVVQPLVPAAGKPLLSYQFAINSAGLKCAPSHQVTGGRDNSNTQLEALIYLPEVLALGWTLVFPDHLGPTSSVAVGRIAAPIVLDGIRAALKFEPLGLPAETKVGMMGYSGGALATTWSAALQPNYAPELNIVGLAAGGLPQGEPVLLSYQFAYDSLGAPCVPTHTVTGSTVNNNAMAETLAYLPGLATQGWTIVFPDYEGPYHAYGAGRLSGQATLDAIRAALSFEPLGLAPDTQVGMWGYSGGALATSWAASLQPSYAPELNLVGVASGGTPADVFGIVKASEDGPFFGLIFSAIVGANRAYPELLPDSLLNDEGRRVIEAIKDGCVGDSTDGSAGASGKLADYTTVEDPYSTPGALAVRPRVTLPQLDHIPTANLYVYHEILDELIPIAGTDAMVEAWCAAGAHVSYFRSATGEHVAGAASGAPFAMAYLTSRFNEAPVDAVPPTAQTCNEAFTAHQAASANSAASSFSDFGVSPSSQRRA